MGFRARLPFSASVFDPREYVNSKGNTECVEFVRGVTGLPKTSQWTPGKRVKGDRSIPIGTAIATFHEGTGRYQSEHGGSSHTAIYISQGAVGIVVVDQWNKQGQVRPRLIRFSEYGKARSDSNNADKYYVVELVSPKLL